MIIGQSNFLDITIFKYESKWKEAAQRHLKALPHIIQQFGCDSNISGDLHREEYTDYCQHRIKI